MKRFYTVNFPVLHVWGFVAVMFRWLWYMGFILASPSSGAGWLATEPDLFHKWPDLNTSAGWQSLLKYPLSAVKFKAEPSNTRQNLLTLFTSIYEVNKCKNIHVFYADEDDTCLTALFWQKKFSLLGLLIHACKCCSGSPCTNVKWLVTRFSLQYKGEKLIF